MTFLGDEKPSVQYALMRYAQDAGWEYVSSNGAFELRGSEQNCIFRVVFTRQMKRLNPSFMTDDLAEQLIRRLEHVQPSIEGNLLAWEHFAGLKTVFVPTEKRERDVRFIDAENIENNTFQVTDEFTYANGTKTIRADVVFLINGVPVLFVETKSAYLVEGIAKALEQVRRYHRECPEWMAVLQLYTLTHLVQFYYSGTWSLSLKDLFNWKEEAVGDFESLVKSFISKERVVRIITDFILFTRKDDELRKVVLRPHQTRAVDKIVGRAVEREKRHGLIWHTQGSGKTYTMIVAAKKIMENPLLENPTVIMLVDRNELESQLFGNLTSVGIENVETAQSKEHLQRLLKQDKRGLIVSMIHKFEGIEANVNTRENIFVLVDEAHRTTGGKLGNYLVGALPNATYIGFTGTPIDRTVYGKGTFVTFGVDDPPHGYLDKYSISESIEDGTTVPLHYSLAPNELRVDRETLEKEFLQLADAEGISDIEQLNRILDKAVNLRNMLKNGERVRKVAKYVAEDFRDNVEKLGYKAFLVAADREACTLYKSELDRQGIIPSEYSAVVYSAGFNDPEDLARFHISEEEEKRIRKAFVKPEALPKILIVTEKLLTGFDAPILYCMYLDKPMRDHVLLQTIARVNRPYEDEEGRKKPSGFVLDFVGIFENLEKALAFDSSDIEGIVSHIDRLKEEFTKLMTQAEDAYLPIPGDRKGDKAVEAVLEAFRDEEKRHSFYEFYSNLEDIYDILSPDAFLRMHLDSFDTLSRMYTILREAYEPGILIDRAISRKVSELVQEHTKSGVFEPKLEIMEINEKTLDRLKESTEPDTKKVFDLLKSLDKFVKTEVPGAPYLYSIGEMAERVASLYKQRQIDTKKALEELRKIIDEINNARLELEDRKMNRDVFSVYWLARKEGIEEPENVANRMNFVFDQYPHWKRSEAQEREVRREMYKALAKSNAKSLPDFVNKVIRILKGGES